MTAGVPALGGGGGGDALTVDALVLADRALALDRDTQRGYNPRSRARRAVIPP